MLLFAFQHFLVGVVDELRRSLGQSHQLMDASFLIRISTQGCLNRLAEKSSTPNTYVKGYLPHSSGSLII